MSVNNKQRSVQFQSVEIIELAYAVGDNPSVSSGVPLSIEWGLQRRSTLDLDFFENHRPLRSEFCVRMSRRTREKLLFRSGCTEAEIEEATEEADKTRLGRFNTIHQLKKMGAIKAQKKAATFSKSSASLSPLSSRSTLGQVKPKVSLARSA
jgi:hypothetical protein